MGEARGERGLAVDSNVVIASLIRDAGLNRYIITLTPVFYPSYYPEVLLREVLEHLPDIAERAGKPENEVSMALERALEGLHLIPSSELLPLIERAMNHVSDVGDSLYVAAALYLRRTFKQVAIVMWNKRDFKFWHLMRQWIRVLTPREFYNNYLGYILSPRRAPPCFACAVDRLDAAIKAALLYLNEFDYIITEHLSDGSIELETYCHRIHIKRERGQFTVCPQILDIKECIEVYGKPVNEERMHNIMEAYKICKPKTT